MGNMKEIDNTGSSPQVKHVGLDSGKLDKTSDSVDTDESDTLSDIDDFEVMRYLHSKEESRLKKIIWEQIPMNREYVQEQAAKEAAAAAARKLYTGTSEEIREAQALAVAAAQEVASKKEKNKRKRELETKNAKPAQTAAQHLKKKLSPKINYDALNDLFGDVVSEKNGVVDVCNAEGKEIAKEDEYNNNDEDADD